MAGGASEAPLAFGNTGEKVLRCGISASVSLLRLHGAQRWRDLAHLHLYVIPVGDNASLTMVSTMAAASNGKVLCVDKRPGCPPAAIRNSFDHAFNSIVVGVGGNVRS